MFYMLGHGGAGGRARPRTGDEDRFRGREATRAKPAIGLDCSACKIGHRKFAIICRGLITMSRVVKLILLFASLQMSAADLFAENAVPDAVTCLEGNGDERIAACNRLLGSMPAGSDIAVAYKNRGSAYENRHDYDRAIGDYNKAIRMKPDYAAAYYARGLAYLNKSDYDYAIADFELAIRIEPKFARAFSARGAAYIDTGENDRAFSDLDQAIGLFPTFDSAYVNRGVAHYKLRRDYDRAIADYTLAIRLNPANSNAVRYRGNLYFEKGDYDLAIDDLTTAINLRPSSEIAAQVYNTRGSAYFRKGDYDRALADYDQAIRLDPKYTDPVNNRQLLIKRR
jgi:tetratricopeptide (TPR) repeat protein